MPEAAAPLTAFNRGEVSRLALGRVDVEKLRLAAEDCVNWVPTTLGPMQFRPGTAFVNEILGDQPSLTLPFVYAANDTALIELTPATMRALVNDAVVSRPATPGSSIPGGAMTSAAPWTLTATPGASVTIGGGRMQLAVAAIKGAATASTALSVGTPGVKHALRIAVGNGLNVRIGTSPHADDVLATARLLPGTHSLAFVPTAGTVHVEFERLTIGYSAVTGLALEPAGEVRLPTPWSAAALPLLRWDQSGDVVFVACAGQRPCRIERRVFRSWSVVEFSADDGPLRPASCRSCWRPAASSTGFGPGASRGSAT